MLETKDVLSKDPIGYLLQIGNLRWMGPSQYLEFLKKNCVPVLVSPSTIIKLRRTTFPISDGLGEPASQVVTLSKTLPEDEGAALITMARIAALRQENVFINLN